MDNHEFIVNTENNAYDVKKTSANHKMGYYKYLTKFALIFYFVCEIISMILMLATAFNLQRHVGLLFGRVWYLPFDFRVYCGINALLMAAIAAMNLYTRKQLLAFKKNAPKILFITLLISIIYEVLSTLVLIIVAAVLHDGSMISVPNVNIYFFFIIHLIASTRYFKRRRALFVN